MRYLSVCSGMEAATVAWHSLGWTPVGFSEIEPFPCAILAHRFPNTKNYGSLTEHHTWNIEPGSIDLLVGGTPCQSFSVAGLRKGLEDPRGNLALVFLGLADRLKPRWIVWENVPGVLSSNGGRDFGSFLGALGELGYGFAYRVLDAQHFGVPQRRRRVFVVAHLGDWRPAAEVLFEPDCVRRDTKKGRATREEVAGTLSSRSSAGGGLGTDFDCAGGVQPIYRKAKRAQSTTDDKTWVEGQVSNTLNNFDLGDTRTTHAVVHCSDTAPTVTSSGPPYSRTGNERVEAEALAVTFQPGNLRRDAGADPSTEATTTLKASAGDQMPHVATPPPAMAVRRLTPIECERLQGFPDNWSRIPWKGKPEEQCPDGPRYKACGNSMAVPVMRWIGERIAALNASCKTNDQAR